ncbi:TMED9 protein, partial [Polypterus senegalus]
MALGRDGKVISLLVCGVQIGKSNVMLRAFSLLFMLACLCHRGALADITDGNSEHLKREHSLIKPYQGSVFGNQEQFIGLGVFVDTFRNDLQGMDRSFPYISTMVNNGSLTYDHGKDGRLSELGGCSAEIRNRDHDTYLAIRYSKGRLTVMVDVEDRNEWKECIDVSGVRLPTGYFFGASAATGDLSDNHDIISMKLYQLMVEHTPEEENVDWTKIEPSVSLLKSPKGNYRTQLYDKQREEYLPATPGLGMFVEVKDPDDKVILSRQYGSEGRFTFTSHTPGEHQICLHSNSSKFALFAGGMLRVHLDIQVGEHATNYAEIAAKDKLTELQLRVRQLIEQVEQIQKEQNYQRYREERFRQTSESTNQRVLWWSIIQTLILVAIGFWQMRHLKSFFEAKKLV